MASLTVALAAVLVLTVGATAWIALHPPGRAATTTPVLPSAPADGSTEPQEPPEQNVPARVLDANARMRLRYAWLVASDYARDHHSSFSGLSPRTATRLLQHSGIDVILRGEGRLVLTRFDSARSAKAGLVSIRVAARGNLLLVTRSKTGHAFCFVQKGLQTGIGAGDVSRLDRCAIRWG